MGVADQIGRVSGVSSRGLLPKVAQNLSGHEHFLTGDYNIMRKMRDVRETIQKLYNLRDGSKRRVTDPAQANEGAVILEIYVGDAAVSALQE
jgi:hypothetical protein